MEEKLCYVCSPYRGDVARNVKYAQELTGRAVRRGLVPITPHLYITQALDDNDPAERALEMEAGLHLLEPCEYIMIGGRYGISEGMRHEIERAHRLGKTFLFADTVDVNVMDAAFLREMGRRPDVGEQKPAGMAGKHGLLRGPGQHKISWSLCGRPAGTFLECVSAAGEALPGGGYGHADYCRPAS